VQERLLDVARAVKRRAPRTRDQLERRLAVAILEILPAQAPAVDAQQPLAARDRDPRHHLRGIDLHIALFRRNRT
jgi:hypothetical protein